MIDLHQHPSHFNKTVEDVLAHTEGLGGGMAVLLPVNRPKGLVEATSETCRQAAEAHPDRLLWFCAFDPNDPDALKHIEACAEIGAKGFGEHKMPMPCDDSHSMEVYRLCGELGLPVLIHFEDANYNTGFERFEAVLKEFPKTDFIGHAQTFWANISAADAGRSDYPKEPIQAGGLTDRWLSDYPNLWADLSAGSGLNACERDVEFYRGFLSRHRKKLLFATDCPCRDGHGAGWDKGICYGEKMLARLRELTENDETFKDVTEGNLRRLLGLS